MWANQPYSVVPKNTQKRSNWGDCGGVGEACYENPMKHLGKNILLLRKTNTLKSPPISLSAAPESFCVDSQEKKKKIDWTLL